MPLEVFDGGLRHEMVCSGAWVTVNGIEELLGFRSVFEDWDYIDIVNAGFRGHVAQAVGEDQRIQMGDLDVVANERALGTVGKGDQIGLRSNGAGGFSEMLNSGIHQFESLFSFGRNGRTRGIEGIGVIFKGAEKELLIVKHEMLHHEQKSAFAQK